MPTQTTLPLATRCGGRRDRTARPVRVWRLGAPGLAAACALGVASSLGAVLVPGARAAAAPPATQSPQGLPVTLPLSRLMRLAATGSVASAVVDTTTDTVSGSATVGGVPRRYQCAFPAGYAGNLTQALVTDKVAVSSARPSGGGATDVGDIVLLVGGLAMVTWIVTSARRRTKSGQLPQGRGGLRGSQSATNPAGFAKGHGEQVEVPVTRFADVAGLDEAVDSLTELVSYLRDPEPYLAAGADLPRGFLLVGPPGTGKTLLARAVAGEAGVPFFAIGASEFVESYVGVGAARVRSLFDRAREAGSAIVFIDELDAIGRSRSTQSVPGNEERESTLNQLLVEMDGFNSSKVIVLGATNRPDILDSALLRPGRFDRQIAVPTPDRRGRLRILELYLRRRHVAPDVDPESLSRRTAGFTGADLANLVNEAALLSVRAGTGEISNAELDEAMATIALGPARKSAVVAEHDRRVTAWHEAGHALAGLWLEAAADPISVSIVPRGQAGGVTWFPGHDDMFLSRRQAKAQLAVAMAGRVAEELLLGDDFTQGASQDFQAATDLARKMVTEYGMSSLGPGFVRSDETIIGVLAERVHEATGELLDEALSTARELLSPARPILEQVADRLLDEETLDVPALIRIAGEHPPSASPLTGVAPVRSVA